MTVRPLAAFASSDSQATDRVLIHGAWYADIAIAPLGHGLGADHKDEAGYSLSGLVVLDGLGGTFRCEPSRTFTGKESLRGNLRLLPPVLRNPLPCLPPPLESLAVIRGASGLRLGGLHRRLRGLSLSGLGGQFKVLSLLHVTPKRNLEELALIQRLALCHLWPPSVCGEFC